ncbi:MAG: GIY-YIG nuclease family protein [Bacteroidetes bacterium]|nr:GIY-YIG nuclease family protein [Bacteroidota bacterium]
MKEEERALRELERAKKSAEQDEIVFEKEIEKTKQQLESGLIDNKNELLEKIAQLEAELQLAHERKDRAISMAQQTKVGHIYVVSNIGAFGENVYKIGMTRRLDPKERVKELGDASVPFHFDVHAIIYSENAPQLEYEIHKQFDNQRLNKINYRKEFFKITLDELEKFILTTTNAEIEFTKLSEAAEYRQTLALIEKLSITNQAIVKN